jgi:predicted Zn-dependent protease
MRLHPNDPQVLQLLVLLDQQRGRHIQATTELTTRFKGLEPGQRLEIGLLLADLLRQSGSHQEAVNLYRQLAAEEPSNTRPLLALALLQQDQGQTKDVEVLLKQARQRRDSNGRIDPLIDVLAGRLKLSAARNTASEQPGPTAIRADSGRP